MPKFFRHLRIVFSIGCGIAFVLLILLWVRSYWWCDIVYYRPGPNAMFLVRSADGEVSFGNWSRRVGTMGDPPDIGWTRRALYIGERSEVRDVSVFRKVLREFRLSQFGYQAPDWFFAILLVAQGSSFWLSRWKGRFSLRTLLIVLTLVAALLGVIVRR
jgi:hypothetical protein